MFGFTPDGGGGTLMGRRGEGVSVLSWVVSIDCSSRKYRWETRKREESMSEEVNTEQEETDAYQHCLYLVLCEYVVFVSSCSFLFIVLPKNQSYVASG